MPGFTTYRGNPQPFNDRVQLERDREAARAVLEERMLQAQRDASPIITPAPRRKATGGPVTPGATPVVVGESGPETIVPDAPGAITPSTEKER